MSNQGISRFEAAAWICVLGLVNLPLVAGLPPSLFRFDAGLVLGGEWWRLATHALAHVSLYHLLLDGVVFLLFLGELPGRPAQRVAGVGFLAVCGLAGAWAWNPWLGEMGLSGLSGVCHGLGVVAGTRWMASARDRATFGVGLAWSLTCLLKPMGEMLLGQNLLGWAHLGDVGIPAPECHLGGALGGVVWSLGGWLRAGRGEHGWACVGRRGQIGCREVG